MNSREAGARKLFGESHQRGPQTAMHVGNLALHEPAHEYVGAIPDRAAQCEYLAAPVVRPPAAADRAAGDRGGERRHEPGAGLERHAMRAHKCQGLSRRHERSPCALVFGSTTA